MSPEILALIVQGFQAAVTATPQLISVAEDFITYIGALTQAGAITVAQQAAVKSHVDAICAAMQSGQTPPSWQVQPDPA